MKIEKLNFKTTQDNNDQPEFVCFCSEECMENCDCSHNPRTYLNSDLLVYQPTYQHNIFWW